MFAIMFLFPGEWLFPWVIEHPDAAMSVGMLFLTVLGAIGGLITAIARAIAARKLDGSGVDVAMRGLLDLLPDVWGFIQTIRKSKSSSAPVVEPIGPKPVEDVETAARAGYEASNNKVAWSDQSEEVRTHWRTIAKADPSRTTRRGR